MAKMMIRVILKNGSEFTIEKNGLGQMIGYDIDGITKTSPFIWTMNRLRRSSACFRMNRQRKRGGLSLCPN